MKQDTKKIVLLGGVALAGLYAYSTMGGEDYAGMGGGGGMTLLPTLPEAAGAAEAVAPIVVNIPGMEAPIGWDAEGTKKTQAIIDKYESVYAPAQAALDISTRLGAPTAADVAAYGESKKASEDAGGTPWYAPWTWDTSEAVENYQAWATGSTTRTLGIETIDKSGVSDRSTKKTIANVVYAKTRAKTKAASYGITSHKGGSSFGRGKYYPSKSGGIGKTVYGGTPISSARLSAETKTKKTMREKSGYGGYI